MRRTVLKNSVMMVAIKKNKGMNRNMDIFFIKPGNKKEYAFSTRYTDEVYALCKSKIQVNHVAGKRSRNRNLMTFIKYLNLMLPYLVKEMDLPTMA